jgi:hypothetical protein
VKKVALSIFFASALFSNAGPFALGGWYDITLTSGKQRHVIVREVKEDSIRVSSCDERLAGEEYWSWIFIKNIESFNRFNNTKGQPD